MSERKKREFEDLTIEEADETEAPPHLVDAASDLMDACPEVFTVTLMTRTGIELHVHRVPWDGMIH